MSTKTLKQFMLEELLEGELSPLQKEYRDYFEKKLKDANVSSPAELSDEDMKTFFDDVSDGWIKGKGKK